MSQQKDVINYGRINSAGPHDQFRVSMPPYDPANIQTTTSIDREEIHGIRSALLCLVSNPETTSTNATRSAA